MPYDYKIQTHAIYSCYFSSPSVVSVVLSYTNTVEIFLARIYEFIPDYVTNLI